MKRVLSISKGYPIWDDIKGKDLVIEVFKGKEKNQCFTIIHTIL